MKSRREILDILPHFRGSAEYHKHKFLDHGLLLSEGAEYIRESCGSYWLFDIISQQSVKHEEFQVTLRQLKSQDWMVKFQDLDLEKVLYRQRIPYSDFPLLEIRLWFMNGVCYLPSEH